MTSPPADTASAAPGSRGALLNVRTTVARPNVSPASHHLVIGSRMSRTLSPQVSRYSPRLRSPSQETRLCPRGFPAAPSRPARALTPLLGYPKVSQPAGRATTEDG